jgi:DNA-directed RNA polymerase beta' subunit
MSLYRELTYNHEVETVRGIQFSIMGPEEIKKRSVVEVTATELYQGLDPVPHGLFDPRMGVIDHNRLCRTCEQRNTMCPGHMGHVVLARPVFYVQYFDIIKKLLKCVCFRCSRLLVDVEKPDVKAFLAKKHSRQKRWDTMSRMNSQKIVRCGAQTLDGCGARQPVRITREGMLRIAMEWTDLDEASSSTSGAGAGAGVKKIVLTAEDVLRILRRISDADADVLGFSPRYCHPEWLVCTVLPVPPPAVRPSVRNDGGQRCEDDLTHTLLAIVKANNAIKAKVEKNANKDQIDIMVAMLQSYVASFIDNSVGGLLQMKQRTGRPLRALFDRLCGKEGRIRGNLMGKRVDFSARSVITPDPNISIDELGVPLRIAMSITFPEVVNPLNRDELMKLVERGPGEYPGARMVRNASDGRVIILSKVMDRANIALEEGDIVDRHLRNGDNVLFNRQPSLHKMSMMAHRVRVMPSANFSTFRLNTCVTPVFNADFDGDEMNMHVPQSSQTHEEMMQLAAVPKQIITPRLSKPLIAIVQDVAVGVFKITQPDVRITEREMMNLVAANPRNMGALPETGLKNEHGAPVWTGRDAMSTIIPPTVNMRLKNRGFDDNPVDDNVVVVRNGKLVQGVCDVDTYQARTVGFVHSIFNECGSDETRIFFDNSQKLICDWLLQYGFSVGISDLVIDRATLAEIKKTIDETKDVVFKTIWDVHAGRFENLSTKNNAEHFEAQVNAALNKAINSVGKMGKQRVAGTKNRMIDMIASGAKGSIVNFAQQVGCLGQQNVDGRRIPYGFEHRTLPHYTKYDDSPEARGFVVNSFVSGLTPQEFFFHAMGGREGLIDTAVKSVTGDTPVVIIEHGVPKYLNIGDWIDACLEAGKDTVRHFPEDRRMELLDIEEGQVFIPTTNENGVVTWGDVTAVTRHDPGTTLYKVTTAGGRSVTVVESKSLIVWDEERRGFFEKLTTEVREGDYLPVTAKLAAPPVIIEEVDMTVYFPKDEYIYGTDFNRAAQLVEEAMNEPTTKRLEGCKDAQDRTKIARGWWKKHNGVDFVLPYEKKSLLTRALKRSNTEVRRNMSVRKRVESRNRLLRNARRRNALQNVQDGCFYPYSASRVAARLPEKFALDYDNGVFVGIYLADGCTHPKSGTVSIAKEDPAVQAWVRDWFAKYSITSRVDVSQKERGVSTSIIGNSTLLAKFMDAFVGHGSRNKHVPDVAFAAPEAFVKGLLSGYFSGDGSVSKTSVMVSSVSRRLIDGVSMLCNRIGVFGKISTHQLAANNLGTVDIAPIITLDIRGQWGTRFQKEISLILPAKEAALRAMTPSAAHINYPELNDVVMDRVASIETMGVEEHLKVYDITVPSTLNFSCGNGLQLRDTSESGYIQRKLVKAMEDCKVCHDYTVRDTTNSIVQFLFGEDGVDPIRRESQSIPYMKKTIEEIQAEHCFFGPDDLKYHVTKEVYEQLLADPAWTERVYQHYLDILDDRAFLIDKIFKGVHDDKITYPIAFQRILENAKARYAKFGGDAATDMHPDHVLDQIKLLTEELFVSKPNPGNRFLQLLLRCFLSPKAIITRYRFTRVAFDYVVQTIRARFYEALAHPGEMVGVVAAQSIGEPTTQLSVVSSAHVLIQAPSGEMYKGPIGKLIDDVIARPGTHIRDLGGDSVVVDMLEDYKIIGVSNEEKTSWRSISQVSRHPANGGMVRVYTKSGKDTCATLSHSFLKRSEASIVPVLGSDLKVGDRIPVAKNAPWVQDPLMEIRIDDDLVLPLDRDFGWMCGAYIADGRATGNIVDICKTIPEFYQRIIDFAARLGCEVTQTPNAFNGLNNRFTHRGIAKFFANEFGCGSFQKEIPGFVFQSNRDFVSGLIGGYFDGDGNVNAIPGKQMIRAASVSKRLCDDIILLLSFFGIFASISVNHKSGVSSRLGGKGTSAHDDQFRTCSEGQALHDPPLQILSTGRQQADQYCPQISRKYAQAFKDHIGFVVKHKAASLDEVIAYVNREEVHAVKEEIDKIPELGNAISYIGKALNYPQQARVFGRWAKKDSIGRRTLEQYIQQFEATVHALQHSEGLMAVLDDVNKTLEAKQDAIKALDERLGYVTDKDPMGPRRMASYTKGMREAASKIPEVQAKLAILRQAAESDVVWDEIVKLEYLPDPGEYVYDFTVPGNDSFMVDCGVLVHNTLNSIHHDEELLLLRDGALDRVKIGEYIDKVVADAEKEELEEHPNDTKLAWLKRSDVKVLSCDEDGKVAWQAVEAVTRHPVVNEDGSNTLLRVTTSSGRSVIATKAKSFLKRIDNKIVGVEGKDLKVGDFLPVSKILPTREVAPVDVLDMSLFLPKDEFLYMTEVGKALSCYRNKVGRMWTQEIGKSIILPYKRIDSLTAAFVGLPSRPATNTHYKEGCVYPLKTMGKELASHVPEAIPLDKDFGWIVGAYLSEGCIAVGANKKGAKERPYAVLICNMTPEFHERVDVFCKRYDIGYHVDEGTRQMASGTVGKTKTLRMHCLLLGELFMRMFGNGACDKRIHPMLLGAPDDFLHGLVDGYFSGDGCAPARQVSLNAYSASLGLLEDMRQILARYNISATIRQIGESTYERNKAKYKSTVRGWTLYLSAADTIKFRDRFTLCVAAKQERLEAMETKLEYGLKDVVPDICTQQWGVITANRAEIDRLLQSASDEQDREILKKIQEEDIIYDQVVSIEEVLNDHDWVYDLTVANTRTFNLYDGISQFDTFHLSGVASASAQVRGVPRLQELLHVSKNLKTPIMTIYIRPEFSQDKNRCKEIMNTVQTTRLSDIVKSTAIYYDPDDTLLPLDKPFLDVYKEWREFNSGLCPKASTSPWLLRLEFDRAKMLDVDVIMMDVERVLADHLDDQASCLFSDDNAEQLVCRIRIMDDDGQIDDMLTHLKALQQALMESMTIKGIPKINKASMFKRDSVKRDDAKAKGVLMHDAEQDSFERTYEWVLETDGTNLREILMNPFVDSERTVTNNVYEICQVLGIEAARQALHDEIMAVLATAYVNYCHISLLIDTMTNKGHLSSIDRHGINRTDIGPLAKSSFEQTKDILIKAGVFAEHDRMTGISANVMLGQIGKFGTGDSDILLDPEALESVKPLARIEESVPGFEAAEPPNNASLSSGTATSDMFKMSLDIN